MMFPRLFLVSCVGGDGRRASKNSPGGVESAFWRRFLSPVQTLQRLTRNVFRKTCNFFVPFAQKDARFALASTTRQANCQILNEMKAGS
jgi:hypothetical protein